MTLANDLEDAWITVAKLPPERRTDTLGSLPPRLWEKLRIALQAEYRQATDEPNATLTVTDSAAPDARVAELEAEVERLRQEITDLINLGIVEVAVRNPNVLEYMRHWEGRAEKAEAEVERLKAQLQQSCPQPADDGWIPWEGGDCPVKPEAWVEVKWRSSEDIGVVFSWSHQGGFGDIIAYRVVQP